MKTLAQKLLILSCLLLAITLFADVAKACTCVRSGTIDKDFVKTQNVFVLRLQSIEKINDEAGEYSHENAEFIVQRVFKGDSKVGDIITFRQKERTTTSCNWLVDEKSINEDYLFFLNDLKADKEPLRLWMCTRTNRLKNALADLLYLEKEKKVRGKTRLSGDFTKVISSVDGWQYYEYQNLADKKLRIVGNGKDIELKTDKNGIFEIYDLLPGKYKIFTDKISGYKQNFNSSNSIIILGQIAQTIIEIKAKSHSEVSFRYTIDNLISGKFFDANGIPLKNVNIRLIPTTVKPKNYFYKGNDNTDKDGNFKFKEIPVGTYIIVINQNGKITASQPFETFYYPNVKNQAEANTFTISPGYFLDNLTINAPETEEVITVRGSVVFEDEKPADKDNSQNVSVEFIAETENKTKNEASKTSRAIVDENGNFIIRILKGQKGKLRGSISTYEGKYKDCAKHDKILIKSGNIFEDIKTPEIEIEANQNLEGLKLMFPYPSCKKMKLD